MLLNTVKLCSQHLINLQSRQTLKCCYSSDLFKSYSRMKNVVEFKLLKNSKFHKWFRNRKSSSIVLEVNAEKSYVKSKAVGYWLAGCSGMVFGAVALGGVTRLTESGLSMVTWKLFGENLPTTEEQWISEFDKYKQYPEFKYKNQNITLKEFKWIWYMEYAHRMWGRTLGAFFLLPAAYFWTKGRFDKAMKIRVTIFGSLIMAQGLLGWYMVKSGLEDRFQGESDVPRVSHYRLASHLTMAFILYTLFFSSTLDHLLPAKETLKNASRQVISSARKFRMFAHSCKGMVFLTALSGAFVAGLDAGLVYNSFPKMGDKWIPDDVLELKPTASNFTENPVTVQLEHRILGITTVSLISGLWLISRRKLLPTRAYIAVNALAMMAWIQVTLGITSLLTYIPIPVAASHQSGSLVLLSFAVWLTHELKKIPKI